jgi:hypothetical protein
VPRICGSHSGTIHSGPRLKVGLTGLLPNHSLAFGDFPMVPCRLAAAPPSGPRRNYPCSNTSRTPAQQSRPSRSEAPATWLGLPDMAADGSDQSASALLSLVLYLSLKLIAGTNLRDSSVAGSYCEYPTACRSSAKVLTSDRPADPCAHLTRSGLGEGAPIRAMSSTLMPGLP